MPFRSVEFGDSIINMKSVLTAQSPWWYQLKTAPFSWHFSCRCFFPFFSFFLSRQIFSMAVVAPLLPRTCAMLQPRGTASGPVGKHLALPSCCPVSVPLSSSSVWPGISSGIWVQSLFVSPCRARQSCLRCPQHKALRCPLPTAAQAPGCHRRSFDKFHGEAPAYHHYLFISVSIPSIPWMSWVKSWITYKVSSVKSYLHAKVVPVYPEVKSVQTPSVRTLLN